jgi:hypothetical protein
MLHAHSFLWFYGWIAPNVLAIGLVIWLWRRGLHRKYPFFVAFAGISATTQLILFVADIVPSIPGPVWWRIFWADQIVQGILKFALIGEIFSQVFGAYSSVARLSRLLIRGMGVVLILAATLAAACAPQDGRFGVISGVHLLDQAIYLVETGLLLTVFLSSSYFGLGMSRHVFGMLIGLTVSACVHLATWAVAANGALHNDKRDVLDLVNMGAYHACVLVWFYYLLVPRKIVLKPPVPLPENNLAIWNRELERLLQQ